MAGVERDVQIIRKIGLGFAIAALAVVVVSAFTVITAAGLRFMFPAPEVSFKPKTAFSKVLRWAHAGSSASAFSLEFDAGRRDAEAIERWIKYCASTLLQKEDNKRRVENALPEIVKGETRYPANAQIQEYILPNSPEVRALSFQMVRERADNASIVSREYARLQFATWSSIVIGFLITVIVSLSSLYFTKGEDRWCRYFRIAAIIAPAVGTAVAAVTAFYSPRDALIRASQTLVGIRQVHYKMVSEIGAVACPTSAFNYDQQIEITAKLALWAKNLQDAHSIAEAAALAAVDPTRSQTSQMQQSSATPR